jgi:hypothetical protein
VSAAGTVGVRELEGKAQEAREGWVDLLSQGPAVFVPAQSAERRWRTRQDSPACKCCAPDAVCR